MYQTKQLHLFEILHLFQNYLNTPFLTGYFCHYIQKFFLSIVCFILQLVQDMLAHSQTVFTLFFQILNLINF